MDRYRVIILSSAHQDIDRAFDYILETFQDPFAAFHTIDAIYDRIASLDYAPKRIKFNEQYFYVSTKNYRIFYRIIGKEIYVQRVFHCMQLPRLS